MYFHDTYFVVAHFHYTLFPAALLGGLAAIYFWFPKMFGRMMNETLGKIHFWGTVISFNLVFLPMFVVGMSGSMRRIYDASQFEFLKETQGLNRFITWAAVAMLLFQIPFVFNFFWSMLKGRKATSNPWEANTLEWMTSSPPPHWNFDTLPHVHRGAYDYSSPEAPDEDWLPQTRPVRQASA
jgi:cytochrome c oxidase subunit 1